MCVFENAFMPFSTVYVKCMVPYWVWRRFRVLTFCLEALHCVWGSVVVFLAFCFSQDFGKLFWPMFAPSNSSTLAQSWA